MQGKGSQFFGHELSFAKAMNQSTELPLTLVSYTDSAFTNAHDVVSPEPKIDGRGTFSHVGVRMEGLESRRHLNFKVIPPPLARLSPLTTTPRLRQVNLEPGFHETRRLSTEWKCLSVLEIRQPTEP